MSKLFNQDSVPAVAIKTPKDVMAQANTASVLARRTQRQNRRSLRAF